MSQLGQSLPSRYELVRFNVHYPPQATNRGHAANDAKGHKAKSVTESIGVRYRAIIM